MVLTLLVLYGLTALVMLLSWAGHIQNQMISEIQYVAQEKIQEFQTVWDSLPENADQSEYIWACQKAMVDNQDGLETTYPIRCVSTLSSALGGYGLHSRNMLFATITWQDGTVEQIPMVFQDENSADVAELLMSTNSLVALARLSDVCFEGYWEDGLFYLTKVTSDELYVQYASAIPMEPSQPATTIQVVLPTDEATAYATKAYSANATAMTLEPFWKSYGSDSRYGSFASQWEKTDQLLGQTEELPAYVWPEDDYFGTRDRNIFKTRVVALQKLADRQSLADFPYLYFCYTAEFSPLALAWKALLKDGMLMVLLALFVLTGAFLLSVYTYARQQEVRGYRDEIAQKTQALEYAQDAEQSRREMTSAIAHELKTPVAVLSSYAEALGEGIDPAKQDHYLAVIREETGKMDRMVMELLDLSRLEAGKYKLRREEFDLEELTQEVLEPLMERIQEKEITLVWQVGKPKVQADRYRMGQVIENFMTNAIRHTTQGGRIVLRIGTAEETFSVENQGKPIPQDQLKKVWERFWQGDASRNEKGSGLGLAICRTIVQLHGGTCKAENTMSGVRFSVSLQGERRHSELSRMPQEQEIRLEYLIAQRYTTLERLVRHLALMTPQELDQELRAGHISLGQEPISRKTQKLYPSYELRWREYRITIREDSQTKQRALLMERMRPGGLGNPNTMVGYGGGHTK
jgi:signal transduction histidine kinase